MTRPDTVHVEAYLAKADVDQIKAGTTDRFAAESSRFPSFAVRVDAITERGTRFTSAGHTGEVTLAGDARSIINSHWQKIVAVVIWASGFQSAGINQVRYSALIFT